LVKCPFFEADEALSAIRTSTVALRLLVGGLVWREGNIEVLSTKALIDQLTTYYIS
jgi:hypothetical protein